MEKKIFFIDFDGTLMRDDKTISEIGGMMKDLLFWNLMYLYPRFIRCRRCFLTTDVSALP